LSGGWYHKRDEISKSTNLSFSKGWFTMVGVDRAVLVVRPKSPFLDWAANVDEEVSQDSLLALTEDCTAYLVREIEDEGDRAQLLDEMWNEIFEEQLDSWHADRERWPEIRDLDVFFQWFTLEFHSVVLDAMHARILRDDEPIEGELEEPEWPSALL
jgi:hypothetical protein